MEVSYTTAFGKYKMKSKAVQFKRLLGRKNFHTISFQTFTKLENSNSIKAFFHNN